MMRLKTLYEFLKEDPSDVFTVYAIALEHLKLNETEKAFHFFKEVIRADPGYLAVYYQLGKLYEQQGDMAEAMRIYKAGVEIARAQKENKTLNELLEALSQITDE